MEIRHIINSKDTFLRAFYACYILNLFMFFGLLITNRLYLDDLGRSTDGYFGWIGPGRPLADVVAYLLNIGSPTVYMSPLPQLLSIGIVSCAGLYLAASYRMKSPFAIAICTLPLAGQPYFMQNMSYSFDSPSMSLALLLSVVAAVHSSRTGKYNVLIAFVCILSALCLYQPAISVYFVTSVFLILKVFDVANPFKYIRNRSLLILVAVIPGFAVYWMIVRSIKMGRYPSRFSHVLSSNDFIHGAYSNFKSYIQIFYSDWNSTITGYLMLGVVLLGCAVIIVGMLKRLENTSLSKNIAVMFIVVPLLASIPVLSYSPQIFMTEINLVPRTFIGVGAIMTLCCLTICKADNEKFNKKLILVSYLPVLILAYTMMVFAYSFAKANSAQNAFENTFLERIISDADEISLSNPIEGIGFIGTIALSPVTANTIKKFPLIDRLVPSHVNNNSHWGHIKLRSMGLSLNRVSLSESSRMQITSESIPVISRARYAMHLWNDQLIVHIKQ